MVIRGGKMGYMRNKKKSVSKKILLLIMAIAFSLSTVLLAVNLPKTWSNFTKAKETLAEVNSAKEKSENDIKEVKDRVAKLQTEVEGLTQDLKVAQDKNPELYKALKNEEVKTAYLTFDDGPSANTEKILDFLAANNIKATFFVVGKSGHDDLYKRIVDEGHTLAIHSNTHEYNEIYVSVDTFMNDITKLSDKIYNLTGIHPKVMRFPGGSNNTISKRYGSDNIMDKIVSKVKEEGYSYFDWNVDSSDATAVRQDKNVIVQSVLEGAKNKKEAVVLMHDAAAKTTTVDALPEIVEGLRKEGFVFDKLTEDTPPVRFKG